MEWPWKKEECDVVLILCISCLDRMARLRGGSTLQYTTLHDSILHYTSVTVGFNIENLWNVGQDSSRGCLNAFCNSFLRILSFFFFSFLVTLLVTVFFFFVLWITQISNNRLYINDLLIMASHSALISISRTWHSPPDSSSSSPSSSPCSSPPSEPLLSSPSSSSPFSFACRRAVCFHERTVSLRIFLISTLVAPNEALKSAMIIFFSEPCERWSRITFALSTTLYHLLPWGSSRQLRTALHCTWATLHYTTLLCTPARCTIRHDMIRFA